MLAISLGVIWKASEKISGLEAKLSELETNLTEVQLELKNQRDVEKSLNEQKQTLEAEIEALKEQNLTYLTRLSQLPNSNDSVLAPPSRSEKTRLVFTGQIEEVAPLPPDLDNNDYPEAVALLRVKPDRMLYGERPRDSLIVGSWVLWGDEVLPAAKLKPGATAYFDVIPASSAPKWMSKAARFDNLDYGFDEEIWYDSIRHQLRMTRLSNDAPKRERISAFESWIESKLNNRSWDEAIHNYTKHFLPEFTNKGKIGFYADAIQEKFLHAEDLFRAPYSAVPPAAAILDMADYFESHGVDFIFASAPSKVELYPEMWVEGLPEDVSGLMAPQRYELLQFLSQQGIEVIDLAEHLRQARATEEDQPYWFTTKGADPHLSFTGVIEVSKVLANRWSEHRSQNPVKFGTQPINYRLEGRDFEIDQLLGPDGKPFQPNPESELAIIGDSNVYWWQEEHIKSAGVSAYVSKHLGRTVDEYSSGSLAPHHLRPALERLIRKKSIIYLQSSWVFWDVRSPWKMFSDPFQEGTQESLTSSRK